MSGHTPGPWKAGPVFMTGGKAIFFTDDTKPGKWQRRVDRSKDGVFSPEDASLIAAAPRMLSAIRRARQKLVTYTSIYDGDKELRSLLREWDEILAAAEGRSHQEQS